MAPSLMERTMRALTEAEALGALAVWLDAKARGRSLRPELEVRLEALARGLGTTLPVDPAEAQMAAGAIRAFLGQAVDFIDQPERPGGWEPPDAMLESQGRGSVSVSKAIAQLAPQVFDLQQRLSTPGARFLDIGTGTAWLAIGLAQRFPQLHVDGIDLFERALRLAKANVEREGLEARVTLRQQDVVGLTSDQTYACAWVPAPFLPRDVAQKALETVHRALVPGGVVLFGTYGDFGDERSRTLAELRTLRSGGHPWTGEEITRALAEAGYADAREVATPDAPLRLWVARRAEKATGAR